MFCTLADVQLIEKEAVIIFDEYYHAVYKHLMTINGDGNMQGIFGLRSVGARRLMLGGLCGTQFKFDILPRLVDKPVFVDRYTSIFEMLGQKTEGET
jgi:hypothetical protein